jgi:hypothetical protein
LAMGVVAIQVLISAGLTILATGAPKGADQV